MSWVEDLFQRMAFAYGSRFLDMWSSTDLEGVKAYWAARLGELNRDELRRGVSRLATRDWPPTLPEFIKLCRPNLDPAIAYHEAIEQGSRRERGEPESWSHPAIYWAWVKIGAFAITHQPYEALRARWSEALQGYADDPALPPVPDRCIALPTPGGTRLQPERARTLLAQLRVKRMDAPEKRGDGRDWARALIVRRDRGDCISFAQYALAEQALGLR